MRTIMINKFYKEEFTILQKCCSEDNAREFLKYIYYDGKGTFVSTNGKWMAVMDMSGSQMEQELGEEEGKFTYMKDMLIEHIPYEGESHFPDYTRVVPQGLPKTEQIPALYKVKKANEGSQRLSDLVFTTGKRINGDVAPVLKEMTGTWEVSFDPDVEYRAVLLTSGRKKLVVMPLANR